MEGLPRDALWLVAMLAAPVLLAGLLTAFAISLFQAATQILEPTLVLCTEAYRRADRAGVAG